MTDIYVPGSSGGGGGPITVNQGTSPWIISGAVTQGTSPWVVSGTITANQGTSPWVVSGSVSVTGSVAVTQSTSPWVVSGTITANQGTSPWVTSISGTVGVTQSTSPWVVSGTVTANQGTSPWVISGTVTSSLPALPTAPLYGQTKVAVTNTAVQLPNHVISTNSGVVIQALAANSALVYIGDSSVTSANGYQLQPGQAVGIEIANTNELYVNGTANDGVCFLGS